MNWTPARIHSFIKGAIRSGSQRWPPRYEVLAEAKRGKRVNEKTGRVAEHYECAMCHNLFPAKEVQVDHLLPIVGVEGFISWDELIRRTFCDKEGLQVLCRSCHATKSKQENTERRNNKNNKKA